MCNQNTLGFQTNNTLSGSCKLQHAGTNKLGPARNSKQPDASDKSMYIGRKWGVWNGVKALQNWVHEQKSMRCVSTNNKLILLRVSLPFPDISLTNIHRDVIIQDPEVTQHICRALGLKKEDTS